MPELVPGVFGAIAKVAGGDEICSGRAKDDTKLLRACDHRRTTGQGCQQIARCKTDQVGDIAYRVPVIVHRIHSHVERCIGRLDKWCASLPVRQCRVRRSPRETNTSNLVNGPGLTVIGIAVAVVKLPLLKTMVIVSATG
jgi:hypothetical protein